MRLRLLVISAIAVILAGCSAGATPGAGGATAPTLSDPTATGTELVNRYFDLIKARDTDGLRDFLSPAFQLERADGTGTGKDDWLANLPTVNSFQLTQIVATQDGGALAVRYLATVEGLVNGKPYTPGPAPRLSVFVWSGGAWRLVAHSNFNPLTG